MADTRICLVRRRGAREQCGSNEGCGSLKNQQLVWFGREARGGVGGWAREAGGEKKKTGRESSAGAIKGVLSKPNNW